MPGDNNDNAEKVHHRFTIAPTRVGGNRHLLPSRHCIISDKLPIRPTLDSLPIHAQRTYDCRTIVLFSFKLFTLLMDF